MTPGVGTTARPARAHVTGPGRAAVPALIAELSRGLGGAPATAVLYFASIQYDPDELAEPIAAAFPDAAVIGCSTAGEFTDQVMGTGGISALALPYGILTGAVAALADLSTDAAGGTWEAVRAIETTLGVVLRDLDPRMHVGFALIDGVNGAEETVTDVLGNAAPVLDIVGGSAGDDLAFRATWVAVGRHISYRGAALMICQSGVSFRILKTSSFAPLGRTLTVTDCDLTRRAVLSIDHRPAAVAYADALGVAPEGLTSGLLLDHPLAMMIDNEPWVRSPQAVLADGGLMFFAHLRPGMQVEVMRPTDLIVDTRRALADTCSRLAGPPSGAVLFNSVLRRLRIDAHGLGPTFLRTFGGLPLAGFHTYGETWLGHVNQTLTGIVFG